MSDKQLSGKVAVVTGASRGLGRQMSAALAAAGASLALVGRDAAALEGVEVSITGHGGRAEVFLADVADEASVGSLHNEIHRRLGDPDILINNAGINVRKPLHELPSRNGAACWAPT